MFILVCCICSPTCIGPVFWWTCTSGSYPKENLLFLLVNNLHYSMWLKFWYRNKDNLYYSLYFEIMGEGDGLAWVFWAIFLVGNIFPILLGECCQFSFISVIPITATGKKTLSILVTLQPEFYFTAARNLLFCIFTSSSWDSRGGRGSNSTLYTEVGHFMISVLF